MFSQSRVKFSASLTNVRSLVVGAFDLVNCFLSVVGFVPVRGSLVKFQRNVLSIFKKADDELCNNFIENNEFSPEHPLRMTYTGRFNLR